MHSQTRRSCQGEAASFIKAPAKFDSINMSSLMLYTSCALSDSGCKFRFNVVKLESMFMNSLEPYTSLCTQRQRVQNSIQCSWVVSCPARRVHSATAGVRLLWLLCLQLVLSWNTSVGSSCLTVIPSFNLPVWVAPASSCLATNSDTPILTICREEVGI